MSGYSFFIISAVSLLNIKFMNAKSAPYFNNDVLFSKIEKSEESNVELSCPVNGDPTPLIQWSLNNVPLHDLSQSNKRLILDGGRILRILNLNHDLDSGLYQCNASNFFGQISKKTFLDVKAFAPQFKMPAQRIWKVIRNSNVSFNCEVNAAPAASINWVDANDLKILNVPGKIEIFSNHTFRIYEVSNADEGYYYCNVSNKYGLNRALNKLEVYTFTYFEEVPSPKYKIVNAFDLAEFRCKVIADSRLSVDYLWTLNGKSINTTSYLNKDGVNILTLKNLRGHSSGRVTCVAVTDVDVKTASIELIVKDIPEPPILMKIDCYYNSPNRALIVWQKSLDRGASITHYTINSTTSFQSNIWKSIYIEKNMDRDLYKFIYSLSPWVNYTFSITSHNAYGVSEPSISQKNICQTPMDVPYENPKNVRVLGTKPGNLVIQWQPMNKHDWNAPQLRYLIRYRLSQNNIKQKTQIDFNNQITKKQISKPFFIEAFEKFSRLPKSNNKWNEFFVEDSLANETIIREQPIFRQYEVQIRAVNLIGYSANLPLTFTGFSGEDVPEISPKNLRVKNYINFSTVELIWDSIPVETLRGHFKGYKLSFWLSNRPYFNNYIFVDNKTLNANISDLSAITNYSVQVFALNNQYSSPPSNLLQFATTEGPPSKVHDMRVYAVGATSIYVTWQPPIHTNGNIRGYYISFKNLTNSVIDETFVLYKQLHYLHEFLEPDFPYKVSVWGETNGGEGPKVIKLVRTWELRNPDIPTFTIRVSSPHSANIEWHPAGITLNNIKKTHWKFPGTSFSVKYKRLDKKKWHKSDNVKLPFVTLEIINLNENSDYEFIGIAKEDGRLTESEPVFIRTESKRRLTIINSEKLRNAAWFVAILIAVAITLIIVAFFCCIAKRRQDGFYEIRIRDERFRRFESIYSTLGSVEGSMRSGTSSSETTVPFFDDTSEEHKRFLDSSYKEILLSTKKNLKNKECNTQKIEIQEATAIPQKPIFIPRIPPPVSQPKTLCPKFKNYLGNQQRLQLPSPVIESVEPMVENDSAPISPNLLFKSEETNNDLTSNHNNAATLCIRDTLLQEIATYDSSI